MGPPSPLPPWSALTFLCFFLLLHLSISYYIAQPMALPSQYSSMFNNRDTSLLALQPSSLTISRSTSRPATIMMSTADTSSSRMRKGHLLAAQSPGGRVRRRKSFLSATEEAILLNQWKEHQSMLKVKTRLGQSLGREPTLSEWARAMGMNEGQVKERMKFLAQAGRKLVESNQLFISWCVKKYHKAAGSLGVDPADLFQEGALGFLKAAEMFDETRGFRLNTFAGRLIQQALTHSMAQSATIFSMSHYSLYRSIKLKKLRNKYMRAGEMDLSEMDNQIREDLGGMTLVNYNKLLKAAQFSPASNMDSFQEVQQSLCRMVTEEETPNMGHVTGFLGMRKTLEAAMHQSLVPYERDVLRLTYGIDDGQPRNRRAVARMLEIRHSHLLVIEKEALNKLERALPQGPFPTTPLVNLPFDRHDEAQEAATYMMSMPDPVPEPMPLQA